MLWLDTGNQLFFKEQDACLWRVLVMPCSMSSSTATVYFDECVSVHLTCDGKQVGHRAANRRASAKAVPCYAAPRSRHALSSCGVLEKVCLTRMRKRGLWSLARMQIHLL